MKVLSPDMTRNEDERQRFVRAVKTMIDVRDANIVELYNAGKTGPYCWCAMQYIDGENLARVIDRMGIEGMLDWRGRNNGTFYFSKERRSCSIFVSVVRSAEPVLHRFR